MLSNPLSVTETFTISVTDVNESPFNLTISGDTVKENGFSGEIVGDLAVQDPDTPVSRQVFLNAQVNLTIRLANFVPSAFTEDRFCEPFRGRCH